MEARDEEFMRYALAEAEAALREGEVPVGAVVTVGGEVKAMGHNSVIASNDPTAHAEIVAIRGAGSILSNYRLSGATLYTTIEPCAMCAGALIHARIERLVYGARDPRAGAIDTHFGIGSSDFLNHKVKIRSGVLEADCRAMIQCFFRRKRSGS